jgi:hypothetical protein
VYPHADGPIVVKWELKDGAVEMAWEAPEVVSVMVAGKAVDRTGSARLPATSATSLGASPTQ